VTPANVVLCAGVFEAKGLLGTRGVKGRAHACNLSATWVRPDGILENCLALDVNGRRVGACCLPVAEVIGRWPRIVDGTWKRFEPRDLPKTRAQTVAEFFGKWALNDSADSQTRTPGAFGHIVDRER
jgi:hypothetical protein